MWEDQIDKICGQWLNDEDDEALLDSLEMILDREEAEKHLDALKEEISYQPRNCTERLKREGRVFPRTGCDEEGCSFLNPLCKKKENMSVETSCGSPQKYKTAVVLGRFQPFHNGHEKLVEYAKTLADETIVVVGSASSARSSKNPWTYEERKTMIEKTVRGVKIIPLDDIPYDENKWMLSLAGHIDRDGMKDVVIVGCEYDASSYYFKQFEKRGWNVAYFQNDEESKRASEIRKMYFEDEHINNVYKKYISTPVVSFLEDFKTTEEYDNLQQEYFYHEKYKDEWTDTPYPVNFVTADALVTIGRNVLVIERGQTPGKGLLALPGGFVNTDETIIQAAKRELLEETGLDIVKYSYGHEIDDQVIFDQPYRSQRGRIITHVIHWELSSGTALPRVKAADDAAHAFWVSFDELEEHEFFEDHYHLIKEML